MEKELIFFRLRRLPEINSARNDIKIQNIQKLLKKKEKGKSFD